MFEITDRHLFGFIPTFREEYFILSVSHCPYGVVSSTRQTGTRRRSDGGWSTSLDSVLSPCVLYRT